MAAVRSEEVLITVRIEREVLPDGREAFVATSSDIDIASQGDSVQEAEANFEEALSLFLETASDDEIRERIFRRVKQVYTTTTRVALPVGQTQNGFVGAACA